MGARQVVNGAWSELDWAERSGSLKEQVGEVCAEMGIATGWPGADAPSSWSVAPEEPAAAAPEEERQPQAPGTPEKLGAGLENYRAIHGESPACTPDHVLKQRERRRMMFLEEEVGVVGSAEKFVGKSLSEALQARVDARGETMEPEEIDAGEDDEDGEDDEEVVQLNAREKMSRAERKSRKAMAKLGMTRVTGITRCTMKKPGNIMFVVAQPDVYKSQGEDGYVVFGNAEIEDITASAVAKHDAAQQLGAALAAAPGAVATESAAEDDGAAADESGLEACDIELVLAQTGKPRKSTSDPHPNLISSGTSDRLRVVAGGPVVRALRSANGDVVTAIMALTS